MNTESIEIFKREDGAYEAFQELSNGEEVDYLITEEGDDDWVVAKFLKSGSYISLLIESDNSLPDLGPSYNIIDGRKTVFIGLSSVEDAIKEAVLLFKS